MDDEDLVALLFMLAGGFFLYRLLQQSRFATASSSPVFAPQAPGTWIPSAPIDRTLDLLMPQTVSPAGQAFIKQQEGFDVTVGRDAGNPVIGWGHDIVPSDPALIAAGVDQASVMAGNPINQQQGQEIFDYDLAGITTTIGNEVIVPLTQSQFDALADLIFDIGKNAFRRSTLLADLNDGDYAAASEQFAVWNKSKGKVSQVLANRRALETQMFSGQGTS